MCNPVAASAASFVFNTVRTLNAAKVARDRAALQARVAEQNARIARQEIQVEADRRRREGRRERAAFRARLGVAGVTGAGSPVDALAGAAIGNEIDALDIIRRGQLRARNSELRRNEAAFRSRQATRDAAFTLGKSLLFGA